MADITNSAWSEADANNTQPSPNGVPPGILPTELGGSMRAVMGAVKRAHSRSNVMVTSTGSANAYAIAYSVGPTAYAKGEVFRFFANFTNTGASTLNINDLGNRALLRADGSAVAAGEVVIGQVITVAFDGTNFLAQNIIGKDFKSHINVGLNGDAIVSIEDVGAPSTSFRRKAIYSSRNVGGGNDWLFRQFRPSDGASEDFVLKSGTGGTIWTTGNFNPALKADLAGSVFTGSVTVKTAAGIGQSALVGGSADRSGYVEFRDKDGARHGYIGWGNGTTIDIAAERGDYNFVNGTPKISGNQIWHAGNFNPDLKATLNSTVRFAGTLLGNGQGYIYSDPGAHNVVMRSGTGESATPYRYAALQGDVFRTYSADILADGNLRTTADLIVGEGKNASTIQMRDGDEGTRYVHNNSNRIGFLGKGGDWVMQVADDGTIWSKQLGDLNTRIENRAYAHGDERGAAWARQEAGARVAKTGDTMSGNLQITKAYPGVRMLYPGVRDVEWQVRENGGTYLWDHTAGTWNVYIGPGGDVQTRQLGDLNTRIEDRANAWSATRRDEANTNTANNYFNKATGTQQIVNNIPSFNASAIDIVRGGVLRARWVVDSLGNTILQNGDTGDNFMYVNTSGGIWTKEFGWLNTRIEDRGSAWGQHWANQRIAKTGDTMTGDLTISKANPSLNFFYSGVYASRLWVGNDGVFRYSHNEGDGDQFRISPGGAVWTKQLGDLNQRIEDRSYAWAATRQANLGFTPVEQGGGHYMSGNKIRIGWDGPAGACRLQVDDLQLERILTRNWINPIIDVRLAYAGDLSNDWNKDQSYAEPYGGGVLTSRYVQSNQFIIDSWKGGRWRYLQKQDSYGNWYTVGYV
ncbi:hypothetical protein MKK50_15145 [Methylobacterium sp. J-043]|nr:hypothetical protein [Methylobacterium sp. J-043]